MREDQLPGGGEVEQICESQLLARDAASATGRAAVAAADGMVARGGQPAHHPGLEIAQYAAIRLVRVGREIECRTRLRLMRETISTQSACNQRRDRMSYSARPLAARASRPRSARSGMPEMKQAISVAMRVTLTRNQSCTLICLMEEAISMHSERSSELQSRIIKVACLAKRDRLVHQLEVGLGTSVALNAGYVRGLIDEHAYVHAHHGVQPLSTGARPEQRADGLD